MALVVAGVNAPPALLIPAYANNGRKRLPLSNKKEDSAEETGFNSGGNGVQIPALITHKLSEFNFYAIAYFL